MNMIKYDIWIWYINGKYMLQILDIVSFVNKFGSICLDIDDFIEGVYWFELVL